MCMSFMLPPLSCILRLLISISASKAYGLPKAKTIPRRLQKVDPEFAAKFLSAFDSAYRDGSPNGIVSLASDLLANHGGFLFEGYRVNAEWRKT